MTHEYRECNSNADRLANIDFILTFSSLAWWIDILDFMRMEYIRNRLRMSNFKFIFFYKGSWPTPFSFMYFSFIFLLIYFECCELHHSFV